MRTENMNKYNIPLSFQGKNEVETTPRGPKVARRSRRYVPHSCKTSETTPWASCMTEDSQQHWQVWSQICCSKGQDCQGGCGNSLQVCGASRLGTNILFYWSERCWVPLIDQPLSNLSTIISVRIKHYGAARESTIFDQSWAFWTNPQHPLVVHHAEAMLQCGLTIANDA